MIFITLFYWDVWDSIKEERERDFLADAAVSWSISQVIEGHYKADRFYTAITVTSKIIYWHLNTAIFHIFISFMYCGQILNGLSYGLITNVILKNIWFGCSSIHRHTPMLYARMGIDVGSRNKKIIQTFCISNDLTDRDLICSRMYLSNRNLPNSGLERNWKHWCMELNVDAYVYAMPHVPCSYKDLCSATDCYKSRFNR